MTKSSVWSFGPIIFAIIAVIFLGSVVVYGKANVWKYYDEYSSRVQIVDQVDTSGESESSESRSFTNHRQADPANEALFEEVKTDMRRELSGYTGLNWDRFEATPLVSCDCSIQGMNGAFDVGSGNLYIVEKNLPDESIEKKELLAHELFHSLTAVEWTGSSFIYEGFTERMARTVYPDSHSQMYWHGVMFSGCLIDEYGVQGMIDLFSNVEKANAAINKLIGKRNAAQKITPLVYNSYLERTTPEEEYIIMDVLCHLAARTGSNTDEIRRYYSGSNATAKKYFDEILGGDKKTAH